MTGTLYLGTSGFAYKEWKGPFYPEDLKDADMLPFYAQRFPSVEINYTFRRYPAPSTIATWAERTPLTFRFALKANQRITHTLRLADADEAVSAFLDRVRGLGERLGPILFQCPPSFQFDRGRLESFLGYLPPMPAAFEFRHDSWREAMPLLAEQGAAWCVAETDEREAGTIPEGPFAYLRLRKEAYEDDDLKRWSERIGSVLASDRDAYVFFKHEEKGAGPVFAERLAELLG